MPSKSTALRMAGARSATASSRATVSDLEEIRATADRFAELLHAAPIERQRFLDAVSPSETDAIDDNLWGPAPTAAESGAAQLALLRHRFDARRKLEDESVTRDQAADLLGVTAQMITEHLLKHQLLGFKSGRSWLIPLWEFDADAERGYLPGLAKLGRCFPGGVVSLTTWVTRPSADLDGRTPRDVLAAGAVDDVVDLATSLTAAGW